MRKSRKAKPEPMSQKEIVQRLAGKVTLNPARERAPLSGLSNHLRALGNPSAAALLVRETPPGGYPLGRLLAAGLDLDTAREEASHRGWMLRTAVKAIRAGKCGSHWLLGRLLARRRGDLERKRRQLLLDFAPRPEPREVLYALMRKLGVEAEAYFDRGREEPGTIPIGAAFFDDVIRGAARQELVSALGKYPPPESLERLRAVIEEALEDAREALRLWVVKHNARRTRDINWRRDRDFGAGELGILRAIALRTAELGTVA